jgi:hypothetical protein
MGEDVGEWPVRLKKDVKEPALLPKNPALSWRKPHPFHHFFHTALDTQRRHPSLQ